MLRCIHPRAKPELPGLVISRRCPFGTTTRAAANYEATLGNLKIGRHTRVIFQGFTGRQATANARESLEWGTNIVGGVTPGREGEHLGLPVLPTVRKAVETLKPDATGIYVAAHQATGAIEEAIEAEVPLVVAVAEHIPLHDMIRIHSMLKTQSKSRLVGANSPGIISAVGKCRIGFQPLPCFKPGRVGIVARSGTLSYETAASTFRAGLGQSICIGVGGDILPGTTLIDGLRVLAEDADTEAIALVGEIGGTAEMEAAEWIRDYRRRTVKPKPIAAIIAGKNAVPGHIMGHAGAFTLPGEPTPADKVAALEAAGAIVVNYPSRFGPVLGTMLDGSTTASFSSRVMKEVAPLGAGRQPQQQPTRAMHTFTRRRPGLLSNLVSGTLHYPPAFQMKRTLYLTRNTALDLLRQRGIPIYGNRNTNAPENHQQPQRLLAISINRSSRNPCIVVSSSKYSPPQTFDFDYHPGPAAATEATTHLPIPAIATALCLGPDVVASLRELIRRLVILFVEKEAFLLETRLTEDVSVSTARLGFDDAAFRSGGRQGDVHALSESELRGEGGKDGIVYVGMDGNIGTLVNGAGCMLDS